MRPYTKIVIDGVSADLPQNINFTLSYAIRDKDGFATNTGTRSDYSFQLPATKVNDEIARNFWHVGTVTESEQEFKSAYIEINGRPFFTGKAQLKKVDVKENPYYWKGDKYSYAFYGNNADWVVDIKNKKIKDYDFTAHTFNNGTILAGWGAAAPADNYGYILLKLKDWALNSRIQFIDSTPVIFCRSIIDFMLTDLGYTLNSTFLTSAFFNKLVIPILLPEKYGQDFSDDYLNIFAEFSAVVPVATYNGVDTIFDNQTRTPSVSNPYNVANGLYTVPNDGFYKFKAIFNLTNVTGNVGFTGFFFINGVNIGFSFGDQLFTAPYTAPVTLEGEFIYPLNAGDTINVHYLANTASGNCDVFGSFEVIGEADIKAGTTIDFKYLIPKQWKVLDFIKGISHAFNLVWETDAATNVITVEPSDSYLYAQRTISPSIVDGFYNGAIVDKAQQLDLLKGGSVTSNSDRPQQYVLGWKEDSNDDTIQALNNNEELKLYDAQYTLPENRFKSGIERIENPFFAATLQVSDSTVKHENSVITPVFPIIWSKDFKDDPVSSEVVQAYEPRLLVFEGVLLTSVAGGIRLTGGTTSGYVESFYPYAYMVDYNSNNAQTIPLSFNNVTVNDVEQVGLLQRFYLRQFARYRVGKEVECFMFWTATDLNNLSFRELIGIRQDRYILQEVNAFNPMSDEATRTYLMYDAADEQADFDAITGSLIDGKLVQYT